MIFFFLNDIVGFKQVTNKKNIDLREKLALHSKELMQLRQLIFIIDDEEQFQLVISALIFSIYQMSRQRKKEMQPKKTSQSHLLFLHYPSHRFHLPILLEKLISRPHLCHPLPQLII